MYSNSLFVIENRRIQVYLFSQVFEDAVEEQEENIALNNNKPKSSMRNTFKIKVGSTIEI